MYFYGEFGFGKRDWERDYCWGQAFKKSGVASRVLFDATLSFYPSFVKSDPASRRVLHTLGALVKAHLSLADGKVFGNPASNEQMSKFQRVVALHAEMMARARLALVCWGITARRLRVVKDIRVLVGKMLWREAWHWYK